MEQIFMKGCEAIAETAIRAGCRFFAGYPITPQNEMPEYMSRALPRVGGTFVQGESEVASVNMVYGAAAAGTLAMTSSSSPGISLKSEGISHLAGARLPSLIVNVMRAGPGMGTIQPAQNDYFQASKASGHGGFRTITFVPGTLQEAVDLTYLAFEYAVRDHNPVILAPDGFIGAIMEPVTLPDFKEIPETPDWAAIGYGKRGHINLIKSGGATEAEQQEINESAAKLYERWTREDVMVEAYHTEDAEYVFAAYGTSGRICKSAVDELRDRGIKAGLIRPITISPFPYNAFKNLDDTRVKYIIDVEMAIPAQMIEDVKMGVEGKIPIETVLSSGGNIIRTSDIIQKTEALVKEG
ncbi:3-methyl-2-oxobutanoate dehydrogenase subunit VorB [Clostridia bacterium]|nr:3-methyl-2-oxobutanoate dehydrogenase subunit VorB [Clostridia bacterium]